MSTPGPGSGQPVDPGPDQQGRQPVRIPRRDTDVGRAIDAPTAGVEREELPKNRPDLDKIHHVGQNEPQRPAAPPPVAGE